MVRRARGVLNNVLYVWESHLPARHRGWSILPVMRTVFSARNLRGRITQHAYPTIGRPCAASTTPGSLSGAPGFIMSAPAFPVGEIAKLHGRFPSMVSRP